MAQSTENKKSLELEVLDLKRQLFNAKYAMGQMRTLIDVLMSQGNSEVQRLQNDIGTWSDATFGAGRSPLAPLAHLELELKELKESPQDATEYADCLMLLLDSFRMAGGTADELVKACFDKLEINKTRQWGTPDALGVVRHIPEEEAREG